MQKELQHEIKIINEYARQSAKNRMLSPEILDRRRSLSICNIWHNILNTRPMDLDNCRRATDIDLEPCFDGLTITDVIDEQTALKIGKFVEPFIHKDERMRTFHAEDLLKDDIESIPKVLLDYIKVTNFASKVGVITITGDRVDKITYNSCLIDNHRNLNYSCALGMSENMVQSITLKFIRVTNSNVSGSDEKLYKLKIWINPNKFIRQGALQRYESLLWFIRSFVYPYMPTRKISEIHLNVDMGINYQNIKAYKNKRRINERYKGSTYINNVIRTYGSDLGVSDRYDHLTNTLHIYDKTREIHRKHDNSYISDQELRVAKNNNIYVSRFELRAYNSIATNMIFNDYSIIGNHVEIMASLGRLERKELRNALNRAFKQAKQVVTDFILVDDVVLANTKANTNSQYCTYKPKNKPMAGTELFHV